MNLNYLELNWSKDLDRFVKVDYSKYRMGKDFEITPEQTILFYKVEKAKDEFISVSKKKEVSASKSFPIFGVDINKFSTEVKMFYTIIVLALFALVAVFGLKKLQKKGEKKLKKRRN